MDGDVNRQLENFGEVWKRVTSVSQPEPVWEEAEALRDFIGAETRSAAYYAELARRSRSASRTLTGLSADERRHAKSLQIEYFLMTGESHVPPPSCPLTDGVAESLRAAHKAELAMAESYAKSACLADAPSLRRLFQSHAEDERRHAETVKCLISRLI